MRRKLLLLFLIFSASAACVYCQTNSADEKAKPCKFLSFAAAEKILGGTVELVENSWNFTDDKTTFGCTYRRIENDKSSEREVNLYFMLEETSTEEQSKKIYEDIRKSNEKHRGFEKLNGYGDEAWSQSPFFIMARKGKFTIRLKVNKAVETTSFEELKAFAKRIIAEL